MRISCAAVCVSAALALAASASAQTVVNASGSNGWFTTTFDDGVNPNSASVAFVNGAGSPPLGIGSMQMSTGAYGDGAARGYTDNFAGVSLSSISSMSYSSFTQAADYSGLHIYLSLRVDLDNNGSEDDVFFFEPEYQNGYANPNITEQADATTGIWQNWDARNGGWWSNNGTLGMNPGQDVRTLDYLLAAYPDAVITNASAPSLRLTAGFGAPTWNDFVGFVDNFSITVNGDTTTYDFEAVPMPGAAALLGLGGLAAARRRRA